LVAPATFTFVIASDCFATGSMKLRPEGGASTEMERVVSVRHGDLLVRPGVQSSSKR